MNERSFAFLHGFGFHAEIDLCILMGGLEACVAEPAPDAVQVDPCLEHVHGGRVPECVRADSLLRQPRYSYTGFSGVFLDDIEYAVPAERCAKTIQEDMLFTGLDGSSSQKDLECLAGGRPKWASPPFPTLPQNAHAVGLGQFEPGEAQLGCFGHSGSGIVKKQQERIVARSVATGAINLIEDGPDFVDFQVFGHGPSISLDGDGGDLPTKVGMTRLVSCHVLEKRAECGQAVVS